MCLWIAALQATERRRRRCLGLDMDQNKQKKVTCVQNVALCHCVLNSVLRAPSKNVFLAENPCDAASKQLSERHLETRAVRTRTTSSTGRVPEGFSKNRNWNRYPTLPLNCTEVQRNPFLMGSVRTENRFAWTVPCTNRNRTGASL